MKKLIVSLAAVMLPLVSTAALAAEAPRADLVNRKQLRVCADPADLPFSNQKGEGFENKIAEVIAKDLGIPVVYTWFPKATGFVRMTLFAKRCDLIVGWGQGDDMVLNTNAIYRSVSALVYKPGSDLEGVDTLSDPRLKSKRVGIVQNDPGGTLAAENGLMAHMKGYPQMVDRRFFNPAEEMMNDIRKGVIDAGVYWGPIAGYWAARDGEKLKVVPLVKDALKHRISFRVTIGVRHGDDAWKRQLNEIIAHHQGDFDKILLSYGVPLLVNDDTKADLVTAPRYATGKAGEADKPTGASSSSAAPAAH